MLMENKLDALSEENIVRSHNLSGRLRFLCPKCHKINVVDLRYMDMYIDSVLQNPSDEIVLCPTCGEIITHLVNEPLKCILNGDVYYLVSDGTFVYLRKDDIYYQI